MLLCIFAKGKLHHHRSAVCLLWGFPWASAWGWITINLLYGCIVPHFSSTGEVTWMQDPGPSQLKVQFDKPTCTCAKSKQVDTNHLLWRCWCTDWPGCCTPLSLHATFQSSQWDDFYCSLCKSKKLCGNRHMCQVYYVTFLRLSLMIFIAL